MTTSSIPATARQRPSSWEISCSSIRRRTISSRKNGLPSARSRIRSRSPSPRSSMSSSSRTICSASAAPSGSSARLEALRRPPAQPGRRAVSSGRLGQTNSTGAGSRSGSDSSRSSIAPSAQWMSSITAISGPSSAMRAKKPSHARWISAITARGEHLAHRRGRVVQADRVGDRRRGVAQHPHLGQRRRRVVGVQHAELALGDLGQRPEGDAVAVRQTATADDARLGGRRELGDQPALADARLAVDRHQVGAPLVGDAAEQAAQQLELGVASDQRRAQARDPAVRLVRSPTSRCAATGSALPRTSSR